jgi:hypothetical protein
MVCFSEMIIPPSFQLAGETSNKEFNYGLIWGSCLGFVSVSCHCYLLEGNILNTLQQITMAANTYKT